MQYYYMGDVKKLIPNGWKFQKLYASNYKSYRKDDIIMFVISKMLIEIDNIPHTLQYDYIKFILLNKNKPENFWHKIRKDSFFYGYKIF